MKPDKLVVGPVVWDVVWSREALRDHYDYHDTMVGLTDPIQATIIIDDRMAEGFQRETLLHETLHAILATYSIELSTDPDPHEREERLVQVLAPTLLETLRKNKEIVEFLYNY